MNLKRRCLTALDELCNGKNLEQNLYNRIDEFREALRERTEPWDATVYSQIEEFFHEASEDMGDHSLWNEGGQGYEAAYALRHRKPTLDELQQQVIDVYDTVHPKVSRAFALEARKLLAARPDLEWAKLSFNASDQEGCKLFLRIELSDGDDSEEAHNDIGDADKLWDVCMSYLLLFELFWYANEHIRVTRDKIYVKRVPL